MIIVALKNGLRTVKIPVHYNVRVGESKISSMKILKTGFVPDFCPKYILKFFQSLEKLIENGFLGKFLAAHTIVVIRK